MLGFFVDTNPAALCNIGNVAIYYTSKYCAGTPDQSIPGGYLSTQVTPTGNGSLTETIKTTCLSYWNPANQTDPTNKTTLDTLTQQFTKDYTNWKKVTFDYVFAGVVNLAPSGLVDVIEFDYLSIEKGCMTRFYSYPLNYTIKNLAHFDYAGDCQNSTDTGQLNWDGKPWIYLYGPPAQCNSGSLQLTRWGLGFMDGRLTEKYISTDTLQ